MNRYFLIAAFLFSAQVFAEVFGGGGGAGGLSSNPSACGAAQFVTDLDQDGTLTCSQPANVTGNAATCTALAADPADCAANTVSRGVNAAGVAQCTALAFADEPSIISALYNTNAGQNIENDGTPNEVVIFEDKVYDEPGVDNFNPTTGIFTVPALGGGKYLICFLITYADGSSVTDGEDVFALPYINGAAEDTVTRFHEFIQTGTGGRPSVNGCVVRNFVATDTIGIEIGNGFGGDEALQATAGLNYFSITRIGN